ncbi:MAG TPA: AtpZ/AtpI family protein [Candidatus Limnocylindrales bacterium]|nr:AtpZ/AtpI family protein [Candidatus Limnocylindrales bacterium]
MKCFTEMISVASKLDGRPSRGGIRTAGLLLAIPTLIIVAPLVGFWIGDWADRRFGTGPWLGIAGLAVGFAAAGRETYRIYRRYQAEEEEQKRRR